ncbi:MAG: tmk, partial [Pseudonocardiales bacterium]|nr:tmk [Pseudonocardiales bacterium]
LALAAVPFVVAQVGRRRVSIGGLHATIDGTRFVLVAGGLFALAAGLLAYRKMDDRQQMPVWMDFKTSVRGDSSVRRRLRSGSVFVAFEGGEGSGKSTQIELLATALRGQGRAVTVTHEPGGTDVGIQIRDLLLHHREPLTPRAETLLFAADRAHHVDTVIKPALDAGEVVLTDRFIDSSLAYQGAGRQLTVDEVQRISRWATTGLHPDLTVLLDLPAAQGLSRVRGRGEADKLEVESLEFHERVRRAFRSLADSDPRRYLVVDASRPPDEIAATVLAKVADLFTPRRGALRLPHLHAERGRT